MTTKEMLEEFFKTHSFQDFPELCQALATLEIAEAIRDNKAKDCKVCCAYTSCENNQQKGDGYYCTKKEINLYVNYLNQPQMQCSDYKNRKDYAFPEEQKKG